MPAEKPQDVRPGDVIQITEPDHHWYPCLAIVDEAKGFGCQAYVVVPEGVVRPASTSRAYIRLNRSDYMRIGHAEVTIE